MVNDTYTMPLRVELGSASRNAGATSGDSEVTTPHGLPEARDERLKHSTGGMAAEMSAEIAVASNLVGRRGSLRKTFDRLVREWKEQRDTLSSYPEHLAMCMPYQKIIAIGPAVIPLILEELKRRPDHWFWALHALTDANPVPRAKRGDFKEMVKAWLEWGESKGYVFNANTK